MDLWSINLKSGGGVGVAARGSAWGSRRRAVVERRSACWGTLSAGDEEGRIWGGVLRIVSPASSRRDGKSLWYRSGDVSANGKKSSGRENSPGGGDPSTPDEGSEGRIKPDDTLVQKSHYLNLDWRTFRASLVAQEKGHRGDSNVSSKDVVSQNPSGKLGSKWAHPIPVPETGCILIATDKLDGVRTFERTVILLLRTGTRDPREGPFGVILNRPLHKRIKHMKPTNPDLATTFADCPLHFGGPLDASMFLLKAGESSPASNFEQVVPGICFGTRNSLDEAAGLVKRGIFQPQDFRFFVGYAGWQVDQLREEIESDYWIVAACSSDLIGTGMIDSGSGLWEETLLLMGGQYSDLSRKAKENDDMP
ncbi:unnamed protein product [Spirodela intermedia]|uniref:Uncharacterized protein n=1 Tax=Spirodela intermedia TaxID=51605 RepID=A0A7I8L6T7_SPIIN|nr:unnamed protein product [Spirodela intermedia]